MISFKYVLSEGGGGGEETEIRNEIEKYGHMLRNHIQLQKTHYTRGEILPRSQKLFSSFVPILARPIVILGRQQTHYTKEGALCLSLKLFFVFVPIPATPIVVLGRPQTHCTIKRTLPQSRALFRIRSNPVPILATPIVVLGRHQTHYAIKGPLLKFKLSSSFSISFQSRLGPLSSL